MIKIVILLHATNFVCFTKGQLENSTYGQSTSSFSFDFHMKYHLHMSLPLSSTFHCYVASLLTVK